MPQQTSFTDYPEEVATPAQQLQDDAMSLQRQQDATQGNTKELSGEEQHQQVENQYAYDNLFLFAQAKPRLNKMRSLWMREVEATIERRLYRKVDLSPRGLRDQGRLKPDETIVPMRVIDTNIRRENPAYINYLTSPARQYIFDSLANPQVDSQTCQTLEKDTTTGLRYPGWEKPYFKCIDGAALHGWDATEVVLDPSKPLHVDSEHIGHDNLFFSMDGLDLNSCELLMRRYSVSAMQLRGWIKDFGFDPRQTQMCLDTLKGLDKSDYNFLVYKVFFKWEKVVYVAWACLEFCDNWLKAPQKLDLGIKKQVPVEKPNPLHRPLVDGVKALAGGILGQAQPPTITTLEWQNVDIVDYPIFLNIYLINEEQPIIMAFGRGFLDKYKQEAMTAIATGYVNGLNRASNVYGSTDGDPSSTAEPTQLKTPLSNGALYDRKITFFNTPYPDPQCLTSLEYFGTQNTEETGQVAIAANNRVDSRKTAKEIESAEQTQSQLSTVQVALFSIYLTLEGNFKWLIIQSQALQGLIKLLQVPQQQINMAQPQAETQFVNNDKMIAQPYILKPAGSVDVVERQKMLQQMRGDWPVIQATPLASEFFKEFIRQAYPNQANRWIQILDQQMGETQLVATMAAMLQHLEQTDPNISPQDKATLQKIIQAAQQITQPARQAQQQDQQQASAPAPKQQSPAPQQQAQPQPQTAKQ